MCIITSRGSANLVSNIDCKVNQATLKAIMDQSFDLYKYIISLTKNVKSVPFLSVLKFQ